jgi:hypothetical protein
VGNLQISPHLLYINRFVLASCLVIIGIQHVFLALLVFVSIRVFLAAKNNSKQEN